MGVASARPLCLLQVTIETQSHMHQLEADGIANSCLCMEVRLAGNRLAGRAVFLDFVGLIERFQGFVQRLPLPQVTPAQSP